MLEQSLPTVNAALNLTCLVLLFTGLRAIRRLDRRAHRHRMSAAVVVSGLFLVSYLVYHSQVGSKPFSGQGAVRWAYFTILISHIVLAAAIVPLALVTVWRAHKSAWPQHRRIARVTWPLWAYVSVTGVLVYLMLYWL